MKTRVEDIDYEKRAVTLQGPQEKSATANVDKDVKRFEAKKGDEIVIRHTEAIAVDAQPK